MLLAGSITCRYQNARAAKLTIGSIFLLVALDLVSGQAFVDVCGEKSETFLYGFAMAVLHVVSTLGSAVLHNGEAE